jgi:ribosomal protein L7/L12
MGALGDSVTIKLDTPIGGGERHGLLKRGSRGQEMVSVDDPARVRPAELADVHPSGVPDEIVELARAGKTTEAIKRYRALNGATLDEARAFVASL